MGKKFDKIFESVMQRYQAGGFLTGDRVQFRKDYKSSEAYKAMHPEMRAEVDDLASSGLNILVTNVGNKLGARTAGNAYKSPEDVVVTIAGDHGGGRHYGQVTVPASIVEFAENDGINLPKVPDEFVRKSPGYDKGKKYKRDPKFITNVTDKGTGVEKPKNTPTNLKLAGESSRIKNDMESLGILYESVTSGRMGEGVITEGLIRRLASKVVGRFGGKGLRDKNKIHEFAQSVSMDVGKDLAKIFGGDAAQHKVHIYDIIHDYLTDMLR